MKTVQDILKTADRDDEYLLRIILKKTEGELLMDLHKPVSAAATARFVRLKKMRQRGIPMQYIAGVAWFFKLDFFVSPAVLIPRPETELMVERALALTPQTIIDVGTGSGAIAIALAKNCGAKIFATDVSARALQVAKKNARRHSAAIKFFKSNLLATVPWPRTRHVLITANLPYLSDTRMKKLSREVQKEPRRALYGGADGLRLYQKLFFQIRTKKLPTQSITTLVEIDPEQKKNLAALVARETPSARISFFKDLHGHARMAEIIF